LFKLNLWLLYLYICHTYASSSLCKFSTGQQNITVVVRTIHHSPLLTYYSIYVYLCMSCSSMTAVCVLNGAFGDVRNFGPTSATSTSSNTCLPCSENNINAATYIGQQHRAHAFCTYLLSTWLPRAYGQSRTFSPRLEALNVCPRHPCTSLLRTVHPAEKSCRAPHRAQQQQACFLTCT
jgi:hypothetical protein